jgi:Spy/CpxP family protein refolding chaperone
MSTRICLAAVMMAIPAMLWAQPRTVSLPWWENPLASGLTLTDSQRGRIQDVVREYRDQLADLRAEVEDAEAALEAVFNDEAVDQRRGTAAIDRLARTRADLTRAVSGMTLKLRTILTPQQWQELQRRGEEGARDADRNRRRAPATGATPRVTSNKK